MFNNIGELCPKFNDLPNRRQILYGFLQTKTYQYLNFWENILLIVYILKRGDYCCHK